jgi:hypothetical protein
MYVFLGDNVITVDFSYQITVVNKATKLTTVTKVCVIGSYIKNYLYSSVTWSLKLSHQNETEMDCQFFGKISNILSRIV